MDSFDNKQISQKNKVPVFNTEEKKAEVSDQKKVEAFTEPKKIIINENKIEAADEWTVLDPITEPQQTVPLIKIKQVTKNTKKNKASKQKAEAGKESAKKEMRTIKVSEIEQSADKKLTKKELLLKYNDEEYNRRVAILEEKKIPVPEDADEVRTKSVEHTEYAIVVDDKTGKPLLDKNKKTRLEGVWKLTANPLVKEHYEWLLTYYKLHDTALDQNVDYSKAIPKLAFTNHKAQIKTKGFDDIYERQDTMNCYACSGTAMLNQFISMYKGEEKVVQRTNQYMMRGYKPRVRKYEKGPVIDERGHYEQVNNINLYAGANKKRTGSIFPLGDMIFEELEKNGIKDACLNKSVYRVPRIVTKKDKNPRNISIINNLKSAFADQINEIISEGGVAAVFMLDPDSGFEHYVTVSGINGDKVMVNDSNIGSQKAHPVDISHFIANGNTVYVNWISKMKSPEELKKQFNNLDYDEKTGFSVKKQYTNQETEAITHTRGVTCAKESAEMGEAYAEITQFIYIPDSHVKVDSVSLDEAVDTYKHIQRKEDKLWSDKKATDKEPEIKASETKSEAKTESKEADKSKIEASATKAQAEADEKLVEKLARKAMENEALRKAREKAARDKSADNTEEKKVDKKPDDSDFVEDEKELTDEEKAVLKAREEALEMLREEALKEQEKKDAMKARGEALLKEAAKNKEEKKEEQKEEKKEEQKEEKKEEQKEEKKDNQTEENEVQNENEIIERDSLVSPLQEKLEKDARNKAASDKIRSRFANAEEEQKNAIKAAEKKAADYELSEKAKTKLINKAKNKSLSHYEKLAKNKNKAIIADYEHSNHDYESFGLGTTLQNTEITDIDSHYMKDIKLALKDYLSIRNEVFKNHNYAEVTPQQYLENNSSFRGIAHSVSNTVTSNLIKNSNAALENKEEITESERDTLGDSFEILRNAVRSYLNNRSAHFKWGRGKARRRQVRLLEERIAFDNIRFYLSSSRRSILRSLDFEYSKKNSSTLERLTPNWLRAMLLMNGLDANNIAYRERRRQQQLLGTVPGWLTRAVEWTSVGLNNTFTRVGMGYFAIGGTIDRGIGLATAVAANAVNAASKVIKLPFKLLSGIFNGAAYLANSKKRWKVNVGMGEGWAGVDKGRRLFRRYFKGAFAIPWAVVESVYRGIPAVFGHKFDSGVYKNSSRWLGDSFKDVKKFFKDLGFKNYYGIAARADQEMADIAIDQSTLTDRQLEYLKEKEENKFDNTDDDYEEVDTSKTKGPKIGYVSELTPSSVGAIMDNISLDDKVLDSLKPEVPEIEKTFNKYKEDYKSGKFGPDFKRAVGEEPFSYMAYTIKRYKEASITLKRYEAVADKIKASGELPSALQEYVKNSDVADKKALREVLKSSFMDNMEIKLDELKKIEGQWKFVCAKEDMIFRRTYATGTLPETWAKKDYVHIQKIMASEWLKRDKSIVETIILPTDIVMGRTKKPSAEVLNYIKAKVKERGQSDKALAKKNRERRDSEDLMYDKLKNNLNKWAGHGSTPLKLYRRYIRLGYAMDELSEDIDAIQALLKQEDVKYKQELSDYLPVLKAEKKQAYNDRTTIDILISNIYTVKNKDDYVLEDKYQHILKSAEMDDEFTNEIIKLMK